MRRHYGPIERQTTPTDDQATIGESGWCVTCGRQAPDCTCAREPDTPEPLPLDMLGVVHTAMRCAGLTEASLVAIHVWDAGEDSWASVPPHVRSTDDAPTGCYRVVFIDIDGRREHVAHVVVRPSRVESRYVGASSETF